MIIITTMMSYCGRLRIIYTLKIIKNLLFLMLDTHVMGGRYIHIIMDYIFIMFLMFSQPLFKKNMT